MRNFLRNFMAGRYGLDQLSIALILVSFLCNVLARATGFAVIALLGYAPVALAFYRSFSKDVRKRGLENYRFAMLISPLYKRFKGLETRLRTFKTHKVVKCKECGAKLRLPRGKGKIQVRCSKCGSSFVMKS